MNGEKRTRTTPAYSTSAAIYDLMVGRYAFEHWRENLERLERRYGLDLSYVADVACGTGLAAAYLAEREAEVFACDLSLDMLKEAVRAYTGRRVRFHKQDMRYLCPPTWVSMLNCATDAMNHLLRETDLRRALAAFYAALLPGGYALFDMNSAWQLREGSDTAVWEFEVDGQYMRWLSTWEEERMTSTLTLVFLDKSGKGSDIIEIHRERAYDAGWVLDELKKAGFTRADVLDAAGLGKVTERTRRLQFVACK